MRSFKGVIAAFTASAALLLLLIDAPRVGAEHALTSDRAVFKGCQDSYAPISASAAKVRGYVPDIDETRYRIFGEQLGLAVLVVRIYACDSVKVPGSRPRPTLGAQFGVTLESPDGTGQVYGSDACCNWFAFFWVTDNRGLARWLRDGTALRGVVRHVRRGQLVYRQQSSPGSGTTAIHFAAKAPTPSPFELDATVIPVASPGIDVFPNWWAETNVGSIRIANHAPGVQFHQASGEIRTREGTQMAELFHGQRRSFGSPFSYGRWNRSFTTKSVFSAGASPRRPTARVLPRGRPR